MPFDGRGEARWLFGLQAALRGLLPLDHGEQGNTRLQSAEFGERQKRVSFVGRRFAFRYDLAERVTRGATLLISVVSRSGAVGIVTAGEPGEQHLAEIMERALQLAEETLEQVTRIAVEQIRKGVESSNHVEAAERDLRSALRQLVLAQREWNSKAIPRVRLGEREDTIANRGSNLSPRT